MQVKVLDYGLARKLPKEKLISGFSGTVDYAAPEMLEGK